MDYLNMSKPEVQAIARQRGLPVSGNKEEIAARLVEFDQNAVDNVEVPVADPFADPSEQSGDEVTEPTHEVRIAELEAALAKALEELKVAREPAQKAPVPTELPAEPPPNVFRAEYKIPYGLETDIHLDLQRKTYNAAVQAGKRPRGGAYGAARVGYGTDRDGDQTAIYEIHVR